MDTKIESIYVKLASEREEPVELTMHLRKEADPEGYRADHDLLTAKAVIPSGSEGWIEFKTECEVEERYLWIWFEKTDGISWRKYDLPPLDWSRAEGDEGGENWTLINGESHCALLNAPDIRKANCRPENIINGYSRIYNHENYAWVSDPEQDLPQWVELDYKQAVEINTIYLTFDTDMNNPPMTYPEFKYVSECVRDYEISYYDGLQWISLLKVEDNFQRRRIHKFKRIKIERLKITIYKTGGDRSARIFEVRLYNEK